MNEHVTGSAEDFLGDTGKAGVHASDCDGGYCPYCGCRNDDHVQVRRCYHCGGHQLCEYPSPAPQTEPEREAHRLLDVLIANSTATPFTNGPTYKPADFARLHAAIREAMILTAAKKGER